MNIFIHELRTYWKSMISWTLAISALLIMYVCFFPIFLNNLNDYISQLPLVAKVALSIQGDTFSRLETFYAFVFLFALLFGSIQAMNLGLSLISREFRWKTVDFLFSRPVSRMQILNAKLLAALSVIVVTNLLVTLISSLAIFFLINTTYNIFSIILISISMLFIQMVFVSLGVILSVFMTKIKTVTLLSVGVVMSLFIVNLLDKMAGDNTIWFLIPFRYFNLDYIAKNSSFEAVSILWSLLVVAVLISFSYYFYCKKDIHSV